MATFQDNRVTWYQNVSILDLIGAKDDGGGGDNWSYIRRSNCHHQQTNTQLFTGRIPFMSPNRQRQSVYLLKFSSRSMVIICLWSKMELQRRVENLPNIKRASDER